MIGLFFRKAFFETWDNFILCIAFNFAVTLLAVLGFFLSSLVPDIVFKVCIIGCFFVLSGTLFASLSCVFGQVSDYRGVGFRDFAEAFRDSWKTGLAFSFCLSVISLILFISIPFYFSLKTPYGYVLGGILFWSGFVIFVSLQWFFPVYYRLNKDFKTCVKKSFIIFFDNPGFSVFIFLYSCFLMAVSFFLGFIVPGWTSVLIAQQGAFRLLMFKYDWLEEKEKESGGRPVRAKVPWKEVLADESENVGHRTLKNFFMPWKN